MYYFERNLFLLFLITVLFVLIEFGFLLIL